MKEAESAVRVTKEEDGLIEIESFGQKAKIRVIGVGGGGNNAVNRMIEDGVEGVDFIAVNTDSQALRASRAATRIQLGAGLGAGGIPEKGRLAANENIDELTRAIEGADMLFITCGMGGGTGTGASPVVAELAQGLGVLTVGIVTTPFSYENKRRISQATAGIEELLKHVDTLVVVPNEKLEAVLPEDVTFEAALKKADETLTQGVQAISDMITKAGLINVDFADLQSVMTGRGMAHIGIGRASGKDRAVKAAEAAITSPLLETSINGAQHVLLSIMGDGALTLAESNAIGKIVAQKVHQDANVIVGSFIEDALGGEIVVTIVAAGFGTAASPAAPAAAGAVSGAGASGANADEGKGRTPLAEIRVDLPPEDDGFSFTMPKFVQNRQERRR